MLFTIFLIIAAWNLPLPLWLQICLTVFGSIFGLHHACEQVVTINHYHD